MKINIESINETLNCPADEELNSDNKNGVIHKLRESNNETY